MLFEGMNYHENVSPDDPFRGLGANPLGFELALEARNFRLRPLARQLGASIVWEAVVSHGMELCLSSCACVLPLPLSLGPWPFLGSVNYLRKCVNWWGI